MARLGSNKRKNKRGTAPGLTGKHRSTGFSNRAELKRRKRAHVYALVGLFVVIAIMVLVQTLGTL